MEFCSSLLLIFVSSAPRAICQSIRPPADLQGYIGSKACATCHGDIARKYASRAMAQASGRVSDLQLPAGEVWAAKAGATFSFSWQAGNPQMAFRKRMANGTTVRGTKNLIYYIGSGSHARGFIFQEEGQLFQAPIAYYGNVRGWDLAPGFEQESVIFLGRKIETGCLNCHTSGSGVTTPPIFQEGAVSCERCHGPGEKHLSAVLSGKRRGSLEIVNPLNLEPERRDSICAQCHLTGETRVLKVGKSETSFRPGDLLAEHVVPFVWSEPDSSEFKVVGHFEGLWQSKCKRLSGDRLSCLTCHDPHANVSDEEKGAYYRGKCLGCHQQSACKATASARSAHADSCIACHMGKKTSTDGQHTAFTDHSIHRKPEKLQHTPRSEQLQAFWPDRASVRDYALAYADEAWKRGDAASARAAHEKLQAVWSSAPHDDSVAAQLGYTSDLNGDAQRAEALYRQALTSDPDNLVALANLATHLAQRNQLQAAIDLWQKALAINPGLLIPGLNKALAENAAGNRQAGLETVRRVLSLYPDSERALKLERELSHSP